MPPRPPRASTSFRAAGNSWNSSKRGVLSGAAFRQNRIDSEGAALHLLFEENHVAALLGFPDDALGALAESVGLPVEAARDELRALASSVAARTKGELRRSHLYYAFQEAALWLLKERSQIAEPASVVLAEWFPRATGQRGGRAITQEPDEYLQAATFFTLLRERPALQGRIWPDDAPDSASFRERFRRREFRRLLCSATMRLGHPMIDLWALGVRTLPSLTGSREQLRGDGDSIGEFAPLLLDLLEHQLERPGHSSARELELLAESFGLVVQVNFAQLESLPLYRLPSRIARVLGNQSPVAGMTGGSRSETAIQQFRMPGYPFVMIATDILQEGGDDRREARRNDRAMRDRVEA